MKPFLRALVVLAIAPALSAETVHFTDGTRMEVEGLEIRDNVVILVTPDGKLRSVPRELVDLDALPDQGAMIEEAIGLVGLRRFTDELAASARQAARNVEDGRRTTEMVSEALTEGFDADRIYAVAEATFRDRAANARMQPVLDWLRSPTARRVGRRRATGSIEGAMAELAASPPERRRVELMMRLDDATGTSEAAVEMQVAMLRALRRGLNGAHPGADAAIDEAVEKARPRLRRRTRARVHVSLHVVYRDVSDAELAEYLAFLESDDGRWMTRALLTSLFAAMEEGARRSGQILARSLKDAAKLAV